MQTVKYIYWEEDGGWLGYLQEFDKSGLSNVEQNLTASLQHPPFDPNRSRALQSAVDLLSEREKRTRLARELAKIDPKEEMQLAEQGLGDQAWPEY